MFREDFSQKVTFTLNLKGKCKMNRGMKMRTKKASQTKENATAKALR